MIYLIFPLYGSGSMPINFVKNIMIDLDTLLWMALELIFTRILPLYHYFYVFYFAIIAILSMAYLFLHLR
jgi:hypothetical protein